MEPSPEMIAKLEALEAKYNLNDLESTIILNCAHSVIDLLNRNQKLLAFTTFAIKSNKHPAELEIIAVRFVLEGLEDSFKKIQSETK